MKKKCDVCHGKFKKSKMLKLESVEMISPGCLFTRRVKETWRCNTCKSIYKMAKK
ncbi:hypothetical protein LCGC14_0351920 [marine sediment metagenome]|uniref:Uncharacterized protein n=1 Tax=marine sediment metagenome TaxID=412755 RepID=A0A0F9WIT8_9ZZZZ